MKGEIKPDSEWERVIRSQVLLESRWKCRKTYDEYKKTKAGGNLTQEEILRLSPDNINSSSFWEYIEKNPQLAKDAIAFGTTQETSIEEINRFFVKKIFAEHHD